MIIQELLARGFPAISVPSLAERPDDLPFLFERYLAITRKAEEGQPPYITPEGMESIRQLPFLEEVRDVRSLCEKINRFGGAGESIGADAIRTILTPTLRIAKRKPGSGE